MCMFLEGAVEGRHSRENSKSGQHSRQSSRDKGNHSRQNSRELLVNAPVTVVEKPTTKSIEIYATLPKKKTLRSKATAVNVIEDEEYMLHDRPIQRTGLFGRTKRCDDDKKDKKRARSEERNKNISKDFSIAPSRTSPSPKGIKSIEKPKENIEVGTTSLRVSQQNNVNVTEQKQGKKQHKIRRKLLMGGLIKRKNRSMPDLREGQDNQTSINVEGTSNTLPKQSVDDSNVGLKGNEMAQSLSGYLSEGHLEFAGNANNSLANTSNPNLERSRLMRKSFHGSAGKVLHVAKVPPPPPVRTTSQLSKSKCSGEVHSDQQADKSTYSSSDGQSSSGTGSQDQNNGYWNHMNAGNSSNSSNRSSNYADYSTESHSLPFIPSYGIEQSGHSANVQTNYNNKPRIQDDVVQYANGILYEPTYVITRADVHSEQSPIKQQGSLDSLPPYPENGNVSHSRQPSEEFPPPPYPSIHSVSHSRQASEDFPPPPPPIDESNIGHVQESQQQSLQQQFVSTQQRQHRLETQQITTLFAQLQMKNEQILTSDSKDLKTSEEQEKEEKSSSETWLKELQAKQAEKRMKKQVSLEQDIPKIRSPSVNTNQMSSIARRTSDLMMNSLGYDTVGRDVTDCPRVVSSVKDMAARFEQNKLQISSKVDSEPKNLVKQSNSNSIATPAIDTSHEHQQQVEETRLKYSSDSLNAFPKVNNFTNQTIPSPSFESTTNQDNYISTMTSDNSCNVQQSGLNAAILSMSLTLPHENGLPIDYPEDDISEVAMQNTIQNKTILPNEEDIELRKVKRRIGKKKSVSFCDQVVLVATAEDDEKDSYIPNPILERVLRSAMNKPESAQVLREIRNLQEAEMNRESTPRFQQQTLPLKCEADSVPATPFQDQLRSVNPISIPENIKPTFGRQNSNDSIGSIVDKKMCASYNSETQDISRETYPGMIMSASNPPPTSYSPQLQQQIRYSQNGYPQYLPSQSSYTQTQTSHPRNQNVPLSQTQKPASPYPTQMHGNQYIPSVSQQQKNLCQKNTYQKYYQLEQQHNQMNKQLSASGLQQHQNGLNQRISNHNASPITVQYSQQQLSYPSNQSPSPYPNQYPHNNCQNYPYQSVPQSNRINQPLPQYQPPPNPLSSTTLSYQQKQQNVHNYQQRYDNYQRPSQKDQQNVLAPNQTYPNPLQSGQIQSNMKYPAYQHPPPPKQNKQIHFLSSSKSSSPISQTTSSMQKPSIVASLSSRSVLCDLCRQKQVMEPAKYCSDCDFYMARFQPKN